MTSEHMSIKLNSAGRGNMIGYRADIYFSAVVTSGFSLQHLSDLVALID